MNFRKIIEFTVEIVDDALGEMANDANRLIEMIDQATTPDRDKELRKLYDKIKR